MMCALPCREDDYDVSGADAKVVFLALDGHHSLCRLMSTLVKHPKAYLKDVWTKTESAYQEIIAYRPVVLYAQ